MFSIHLRLHSLQQQKTSTSSKILQNLYVDNVILEAGDVNIAINMYSEAKDIFQKAGMNLTQWTSNSQIFNNTISFNDILGLTWNTETDILTIPILQKSYKALTERAVSKSIASTRTFDPLGLLSPILLKGKLFLQKLWSISLAWDEELPEDLKPEWKLIKVDWEKQSQIHVPRNIIFNKSDSEHTLLVFTDASKNAYATTIYLKSVNSICSQLNLIFSKTRLAPMKPITIPRLELLALTIGFKAMNFVEKEIALKINYKVIFSDSEIVLSWIKSVKPLETFVENRVKPIRESEGIEFRHVAGEDNPADLASRGLLASELQFNSTYVVEWTQLVK